MPNFKQITFKTYINQLVEKAVDDKNTPVYTSLKVADAIKELKAHCSDSLWMIKNNTPFYRGDKSLSADITKTGIVTSDSTHTQRKSSWTSNYYTLILDNIEGRENFPKRSQSFISSTDSNKVINYSTDGYYMILIPYNGDKIGVVNQTDIWDTSIHLFGSYKSMSDFNDSFEDLLMSDTDWHQWVEFDKQLKNKNKLALAQFESVFPKASKEDVNNFIEEITKAYSPKATGHRAYTTKNCPHNLKHTEVWVGGKVMLISRVMWAEILKEFK